MPAKAGSKQRDDERLFFNVANSAPLFFGAGILLFDFHVEFPENQPSPRTTLIETIYTS